MDTVILMVDYCGPTGQRLSVADGHRLITESAERLNEDLGELGWVDCLDLVNYRGATVYLVGRDRLQLWYAIKPAISQWPFRPMTALLRPADRRLPDPFQHVRFAPKVDDNPSEDLVHDVLAAMPRAMWEIPTPQLRAVSLRIRRSGITGRFIYAEPPGMIEEELVRLCETYLYADFTARPQLQVEFEAVYLPVDHDLNLDPGEQWFYLRNEDGAEA